MLRSRVAFGHGSLVLNEHFNTDGTIDESKVQNTIVIDEALFTPDYRDTRDPYHLTLGGSLGRVHKGHAFTRLRGRILVPNASQQGSLTVRELALRSAFDPSLCYADSPATDGAYALDWDEITTDTTNFPSGRMPLRTYVRPTSAPSIGDNIADRAVRAWAVGFVAADPRRFRQTESTLTLSPGTPSGSVANIGTVPGPVKVVITMSGAGASNFTIARGGVSFILNLAGTINLDVITVIMETSGPYGRGRSVLKNGGNWFSLKTSSALTWLTARVGSESWTISNHTNVTSCAVNYYSTWA
jgi:hypothetical protein